MAASSRLFLEPKTLSLAPGETGTLELRLTTGKTPVNALQATIDYPEELVDVSVNTDHSLVSLWVTDSPQVNSQQGLVTFEGGLPTPGFQGQDLVATLEVHAKETGRGTLTIGSNAMILLNDGLGTNDILRSQGGETVTLRVEPGGGTSALPISPGILGLGIGLAVIAVVIRHIWLTKKGVQP